jgi:FkbM family methyltransferase
MKEFLKRSQTLRRAKRSFDRQRADLGRVLGLDRYVRTSLHQIEDALAALFPPEYKGFFVEAGAADGVAQSNTYWLERRRGWRGILVEALPEFAEQCRRNRPRSVVVQAGLVASDYPDRTLSVRFAGLMSLGEGARGSRSAEDDWVCRGQEIQDLTGTWTVRVPARTLTEVLASVNAPSEFDLLSLDVEGMEADVLRGLDTARFTPRYILVEMNDEPATDNVLREMGFEVVYPRFTPTDALYQRGYNDPAWNQTSSDQSNAQR